MSYDTRVLIVEDDEVLRAMLFTVLRHQPVSVDTAADAGEAIEKVGNCDYALVIIDAGLREDGCRTFLEGFRAARPESTTCVVVLKDPRSDVELVAERVTAILRKPVEIETLADLVRECAPVVPLPEDPLPCPPAESTPYGNGSSRGMMN